MIEDKNSTETLVYKAPIALFVYRRADHARKTLEALVQCQGYSESKVYVFCDGAKGESDLADVNATREVVRELSGCNATIIEAEANRGLANSIIVGVTKLCDEYGRVIVLEDDLVVSPVFLTYMNAALDKYEDVEEVMQISGHMFPVAELKERREAFFLPFTTTWGWGTWGTSWRYFNRSPNGWEDIKNDRKLKREFNLNNTYNYFGMLIKQINGQIDSWGILWRLSVFMRKGLTLYPPQSFVNNIGFDGSGTHTKGRGYSSTGVLQTAFPFLPDYNQVKVDQNTFNSITRYLGFKNSRIVRLHELFLMWLRSKIN